MKHWRRAALAALLLAPCPALAQQARPLNPRAVLVGSFEVWVVTNPSTREDQSNAFITPRGGTRGAPIPGELRWSCAEGGGLWVGVILSGIGRAGEARPVEWRFDGDALATASLIGVENFLRWFLPAEDVARFTARARNARSLVIRVPDDGAEYVYELEQPRQALDRLACARGTPVAGRIPQPAPADLSGRGRVARETPRNEGTYELDAVDEPPRIRNEAELERLVRESIPPELRGDGISGSVTLRVRVLPDGRVDPASVRVTASTHEAMNEPLIRLGQRLVLTPALADGRPVAAWTNLPIRFSTDAPAAGSAPAAAAAPQRECSAADSARVGWSSPPGVADDTWRAALLAAGLVAPETELVRIAYDSLPSGDSEKSMKLFWELIEVVQARTGDGPSETVVLKRIEPDGTMSRLLLALPSGMVGIEESISGPTRGLRFTPAFKDGCPIAVLYPIIIKTQGTVRIPRTGSPKR
jgi:TonB family protein